jgi:hypothetical protein
MQYQDHTQGWELSFYYRFLAFSYTQQTVNVPSHTHEPGSQPGSLTSTDPSTTSPSRLENYRRSYNANYE